VAAVRDPASHQSERRARLGRVPVARLVADQASPAAELGADLAVPLRADLPVPLQADWLVPLVPLARRVASPPVLRQAPLLEPQRVLPAPNRLPLRRALSLLSSWEPAVVHLPASL
jgi:hypothetical protein